MEGADPRTDGELLVATAIDPEAFGTFFRRHVRGVLAFFRRRGVSPDVALDLTAETFAAALEASPRYELRPEPARSWLYGIAWNKLHEEQLIDILGVLRRPQTKADLNPAILSVLSRVPPIALRGEAELALVRLATTTPWGEKIYLVPFRPPTAAGVAADARRAPGLASRRNTRSETLGTMSTGGGGGGADAAAIEAGNDMEIDGAGRAFAGGSTQTRYI